MLPLHKFDPKILHAAQRRQKKKKDLKKMRMLEKARRTQRKGHKAGVCLVCLGNRGEASVWSGVKKGESCSYCKDFGFALHDMGRCGRGRSAGVT